MATALAMVLNEPCDELIKEIGYDGSEVLESGLVRGVTEGDIMLTCMHRGRPCWVLANETVLKDLEDKNAPAETDSRRHKHYQSLRELMQTKTGIACLNIAHAVAFDKGIIYDPSGNIYSLSSLSHEVLYIYVIGDAHGLGYEANI